MFPRSYVSMDLYFQCPVFPGPCGSQVLCSKWPKFCRLYILKVLFFQGPTLCLLGSWLIFPRSCFQVLCFQGPMTPRSSVSQVLYFQFPVFKKSYISKVLCFQGSVFPGPYGSLVLYFQGLLSKVQYFPRFYVSRA